MRDIYKNPILYYIAVPLLVGLWPLLVWAIYLPAAQKDIDEHLNEYNKAQDVLLKILALDPGRLDFADPNENAVEFTYDRAVEQVTGLCDIAPSKYKLNSGMTITANSQKSQSANVRLQQIDIVRFAKFLSMIQLRWPNLQCNRVKFTRKEGLPNLDVWDIEIELKYYY
ncbi:MAG: hypothetical protein ABIF19_11380 [Planctomycetota bacterium]